MTKEFLVTAQAYEKTDTDKQTVLLHDTFVAKDSQEAKKMFTDKFNEDHHIVKIYSSIDVTSNIMK